MRAAETLRQDGYDGALTIAGAERQPLIIGRRFRRHYSPARYIGRVSILRRNSTSMRGCCEARRRSSWT